MWSDILTGYGIFILEILTILLMIVLIVALIINAKQRNQSHYGELILKDLAEEYRQNAKHLAHFLLSEEEIKLAEKAEKKPIKKKSKRIRQN
ncbi:peptidase family S49 N-terminal domain protein [Haemophilus pittmaniae HK 85]|uniref:Peptidase family S49 N-terminal domain protein n=1 Tax=Haemophilus pittmaniae HK 85 TaxID=1035188 RepID=F9Q5L2_9PAST|nr:peptidase family S49 N-terminal domain protein [Haemophilus pittmaniae HK 85]